MPSRAASSTAGIWAVPQAPAKLPGVTTPGRPSLLSGFRAPLSGAPFLWRHPGLWPWALAPFLVNLGLFALFFWLGYGPFRRLLQWALGQFAGWWWAALVYLLLALVLLLLLIMTVYAFSLVGSILAAPFLEQLTMGVERRLAPGGLPSEPFRLTGIPREILRVAGQAVKRLALFLALQIALLLINLLPVMGPALYAALAWLVTAFFLALEFMDYPLDRRKLTLTAKLAYIWRLGPAWLGFGAGVMVLGLIPVLNIALLPLAAVGATRLFLQSPLGPPPHARPPGPK